MPFSSPPLLFFGRCCKRAQAVSFCFKRDLTYVRRRIPWQVASVPLQSNKPFEIDRIPLRDSYMQETMCLSHKRYQETYSDVIFWL